MRELRTMKADVTSWWAMKRAAAILQCSLMELLGAMCRGDRKAIVVVQKEYRECVKAEERE